MALQLLLLLFFTCAVYAQFGSGIFQFGSGKLPDFAFEYHRSADFVLVRNATACFIVDTKENLAEKIGNKHDREQLEMELYSQIEKDVGEVVSSYADISRKYHDVLAAVECFKHDVFKLQYPSP